MPKDIRIIHIPAGYLLLGMNKRKNGKTFTCTAVKVFSVYGKDAALEMAVSERE
jgi:hypothetical protein